MSLFPKYSIHYKKMDLCDVLWKVNKNHIIRDFSPIPINIVEDKWFHEYEIPDDINRFYMKTNTITRCIHENWKTQKYCIIMKVFLADAETLFSSVWMTPAQKVNPKYVDHNGVLTKEGKQLKVMFYDVLNMRYPEYDTNPKSMFLYTLNRLI